MQPSEKHLLEILKAIRNLDIPSDEFVIVGSSAFHFNGLLDRIPKDIDIIVTERQWLRLSAMFICAVGLTGEKRPGSRIRLANGLHFDMKPVASMTPDVALASVTCPFRDASLKDGVLVASPLNDAEVKALQTRPLNRPDLIAKDARDVAYVKAKLRLGG